jgi:ribosomal protein L7Ae-like RNA K-turn-binding protein
MSLLKMKPAKQPKNEPATATAVWRILGLAAKAGRAVTGAMAIGQALSRQQACLVLLARDAAENSRQKICRQCRQQSVPSLEYGTMAEIGRWTGHDARAAAAILDPGFAGRLQQLIGETGGSSSRTGTGQNPAEHDCISMGTLEQNNTTWRKRTR